MLSLTAEMRGRTAAVVLALFFRISNAFEPTRRFSLDNKLTKILTCSQSLGPSKCLTAFSAWRAQRATTSDEHHRTKIDLIEDLEQFPWERYSNETDEQLYTELCDGTEKLLQYRQLALNVNTDYTLQLRSSGNGTLNVDVIKNNGVTGRGYMKKWKKKFYSIIPLLIVPGLIMSAILPFVLPALKMMVVGVGILNNMALSGAVFTLLRNNAFNEANRHKIIYANEGYHNEKHYPVPSDIHRYATSNQEVIGEDSPQTGENILLGDYTEIKEVPIHANLPWIQNSDITRHVYYADTKIKRRNGQTFENKSLK